MHWFWLTLPLSCGASISYAHCPLAAPPTSFLNTACSFTLLLFSMEGPFPSPLFAWWAPQPSRLTQGYPWESFLNAPYFQPLFHVLSVVVTPWPHSCDIFCCLQDHEIFKAGKYGSMPCLRVRFGSSFHHSLVVWLLKSDRTSLSLSVLIYKWVLISLCMNNWYPTYEVFNMSSWPKWELSWRVTASPLPSQVPRS